jgi:hypothetical protein
VNNKITSGENVTSLVDLEAMDKDIEFKDYITTSNIVIGKRQLKFLQKIKQCVEDSYLENKKQQLELQKKCLEYWGLPVFHTESRRRDYRSSRGRGGYYGNKRYNRLRPDIQDQYRAPRPRGYTHPTTGDEWGVPSKPQYPSYPQRPRGYSTASYRTSGTKRKVEDLYSNPSKSKEEQAEEIRKRHMNTEEWTKVEKKEEKEDYSSDRKEDKEELDLEKAYQGFE